ncbi:hypothetical protein Pla123a_19110 [Posidoniimonas polymericola]|uniref:PEP-CTERM protein-sorting domain-containing protein n=1 Tax=Posidoniimonas polymericola TaxID=2528002 RepID=A0A5C5YQP5_9BACT|nr:PEP-CTERM sorting domain-containing protein [Posidoniimonas polymericola]TWT77254.1 hypothetical protein Pla123a_19110 [Posidoniimonas polymericola]
MTSVRLSFCVASLAMALATSAALGATPFAGEDFDSGTTNGGFTSITQTLTPDLGQGGAFSSFFDRFGVMSRADGLPFDFLDDSAGDFTADTFGIIRTGKTDNFIGVSDPDNGDNPGGAVSGVWTFDISGRSNIELSIDLAMIGDFEASGDTFDFNYSIDGGEATNAFSIRAIDGVQYGVTLESGAFSPVYTDPFSGFDEPFWTDLSLGGMFTDPNDDVIYDFLMEDDGTTNGDSTANDGFVPIEAGGGFVEVRAYRTSDDSGETFDLQIESEPFKDPLFLGDTQLTNNLTTYTTPLSGAGSTLTLEFAGVSNGSLEYFVFDNILLSEGDGPADPGDFNGDGVVDAADYTVWRDNEGASEGTLLSGNGTGGTIDGDDLALWQTNYGAGTTSAASAVPEPAALCFAAIGLVAGLARRR